MCGRSWDFVLKLSLNCNISVTLSRFLCDNTAMNVLLFALPLGVAAVFAYLMLRSELR